MSWPRPLRWAYRAVLLYLIAAGAFLWVMLWWQRHWFLGLSQAACIGYVLFAEGRAHLRGE